jgi:hypothetical protein
MPAEDNDVVKEFNAHKQTAQRSGIGGIVMESDHRRVCGMMNLKANRSRFATLS